MFANVARSANQVRFAPSCGHAVHVDPDRADLSLGEPRGLPSLDAIVAITPRLAENVYLLEASPAGQELSRPNAARPAERW